MGDWNCAHHCPALQKGLRDPVVSQPRLSQNNACYLPDLPPPCPIKVFTVRESSWRAVGHAFPWDDSAWVLGQAPPHIWLPLLAEPGDLDKPLHFRFHRGPRAPLQAAVKLECEAAERDLRWRRTCSTGVAKPQLFHRRPPTCPSLCPHSVQGHIPVPRGQHVHLTVQRL